MKSILQSTFILLCISVFASDSSALPGGGGGLPGGGCFRCDCVVVPPYGGQSCGCPRTTWGGIGCDIIFTPGWGNECREFEGPCLELISGFAP
jgi:hypothetical protein